MVGRRAPDDGAVTTLTPVPSPSGVAPADATASTTPSTPTDPTPVRDVVVVGVDGSPSSIQALRWARFLAAAAASTLEVVAVAPAYGLAAAGAGWSVVPTDWDPIVDAERVLTDAVAEAFGAGCPVGLTTKAVGGSPSRVLIDASSDARMLVMGSRGHGGFAGLLLGSVSTACAEHAHCPVFVVHGDTAPPAPVPAHLPSGA